MIKFRALKKVLFLNLILSAFIVNAQENAIYLSYTHAKIIRHTNKTLFQPPNLSPQFSLSLEQSNNDARWSKYWNQPTYGCNVSYTDFGDKMVLGKALALYPKIHFSLYGTKYYSINMGIGSGIAYLNKKFDKIENVKNNAIGSNFNNITVGDINVSFAIDNRFLVRLGGNFTHFSNAKTKTPNYGINLLGYYGSVGFNFKGENNKIKQSILDSTVSNGSKFGLDAIIALGYSTYSFEGGAKYYSSIYNLGIRYSYSEFFHGILGTGYEYSPSVYQFYYLDYFEETIAKQKAKKFSLYYANELDFGRVTLRTQLGYYLPFPLFREKNNSIYFQLGTVIRLLNSKIKPNPFLTIYLKSHGTVAQYLGIGIGIRV